MWKACPILHYCALPMLSKVTEGSVTASDVLIDMLA